MLRKILCSVVLTLIVSISAQASSWVGETMETGKTFYLYDVRNTNNQNNNRLYSKFLSHASYNSSIYPAYEAYGNADLFAIEKSGKYILLKNMTLGDGYYLNADGGGLQAYSTSRKREFTYRNNGNSYQIYYEYLAHNYYLHKESVQSQGNETLYLIEFLDKGWAQTLSDHQWIFISEEQYIYRPKLDALITTVNAHNWSEATPSAVSEALTAANNAVAATTNIGTTLKNAYTTLDNAYQAALIADQEKATAYASLNNKIAEAKSLQALWTGKLGYIPEVLKNAIATAEAAKNNESRTTQTLTDACTALSSVIATYQNGDVLYCAEMKRLSENMGYPFPDTYKQELLQRVAGTYKGTGTLDDFIASVRNAYVAWVNAQITAGYGFPIGTDFSAYLAKNGAEAATLPEGTYDKTNGKIILTGGAASETELNEVGGIPSTVLEGNYSKVTLLRSMSANDKWFTFCSPCDISKATMDSYFSRVMALSSVTYDEQAQLTLTFSAADAITAGTAYLVKAKEAINSIEVSDNNAGIRLITTPSLDIFPKDQDGTPIANPAFHFTMYGNFMDITACGSTIYDANLTTFILQSNEFRIVTAENRSRMKAFRAYFQIDKKEFNASSMHMTIEDDETGIETVDEIGKQEIISNLMGQKCNAATQGLYVKNGKVIFIK